MPPHRDKLLTRDEFRRQVFDRDRNRCVICGGAAQDAHHILERRLFDNGGYFLSNGAALCSDHHIQAEETKLSVEVIRERAGITAPALPGHFYPDEKYDKWGNIILPTGRRTKGELFRDPSVQKILAQGQVLAEFTDYVKYPRTLHLPWSPGASLDDRIHTSLASFENEEVVVTEKMDGENTNLYRDYYHARSLDSQSHSSQSWARSFHAKMAWNIPAGWRICAENVYARHSIPYSDLPSYLLVFSIWDTDNRCLSWDQTTEWCALLGLAHVPVLYRGLWNESKIRSLYDTTRGKPLSEGYVARVTRAFEFAEFRCVVGKFVRRDHGQTGHNWKSQTVVPNALR